MRLLLVVNAFASSVTARNRVLVQQALRRDHTVEVVETNRRGHATRFARDAALRGVDVVVAFGGDGTLNEVANGLAGTDTALAPLPGGSTNVFARSIGLPNDPVLAVQELARSLRERRIRRVGLGVVDGRYFCFHTGIGYDAAIVRRVEHRASLKRWAGHPLFAWAAIRTALGGYDRRHPHFEVRANGSEAVAGFFTIVLNTNPYTFLGNRPFDLSPAATLDRGLVAVTFKNLRVVPVTRSMLKALEGGGLTTSDTVDVQTDLSAITVASDDPFPYQVDGDDLGDTKLLSFAHAPDVLTIVVPASYGGAAAATGDPTP